MRLAAWLIVALVVAAAVLIWWHSTPAAAFAVVPVPPGQFPLDAPRPEWPASSHTVSYSPAQGMGSDKVVYAEGLTETKARCGQRPASGCPASF